MTKKSVTSLQLRKLIVKLRNEDKHLIGDISKIARKSKSVIHSISRKLEETRSCKTKKPHGRPKKTTARENRWIGNESKKDQFATASAISKRANADLGIKISRHTISWKLNEINLNSWVDSTKHCISKKNKMSRLKWTEEEWDCVNFSDDSKFNQFSCDRKRLIQLSPKEGFSP